MFLITEKKRQTQCKRFVIKILIKRKDWKIEIWKEEKENQLSKRIYKKSLQVDVGKIKLPKNNMVKS